MVGGHRIFKATQWKRGLCDVVVVHAVRRCAVRLSGVAMMRVLLEGKTVK